jgi:transposase
MPVFEPPASPSGGPIERLWQDLKARFKGLNFASLEALQQWLFRQLESLSNREIRSLTSRSFIRRAVRTFNQVQN